MQINIENKVGARFKLVVRKLDGTIARETDWFNNLVLDSGLARMSVGVATEFIAVGTGNSTPVVGQTGLDNLLAFSSSVIASNSGNQLSTSPRYIWAQATYRFAAGTATGNISEVGFGWTVGSSKNNMFNRALIKDMGGSPTTITVLSDEVLDVVAELRHYPAESSSGVLELKNKAGATISTHTVKGKFLVIGGSSYMQLGRVAILGSYADIVVYGSALPSDFTSEPAFPRFQLESGSGITTTYPIPTKMVSKVVLKLNEANMSHRTITYNISGLLSNGVVYACETTPPIIKNGSQELTYTVELTWGRYTA